MSAADAGGGPDGSGRPDRDLLARDLVKASYLRGDFVLSSGARSSFYFDKYLFETKPDILRRVAVLLAERVPEGTDRLAGPALGAVALAAAVSLETGLPFVIVRPGEKDHGTARTIEGELLPDERVLVLEDVVTTAGQAIQAARRLAAAGAKITGILAVLDRDSGGGANAAAAGYAYDALFKLGDLNV